MGFLSQGLNFSQIQFWGKMVISLTNEGLITKMFNFEILEI